MRRGLAWEVGCLEGENRLMVWEGEFSSGFLSIYPPDMFPWQGQAPPPSRGKQSQDLCPQSPDLHGPSDLSGAVVLANNLDPPRTGRAGLALS